MGASLRVAMPYIVFYGNKAKETSDLRVEVPMKSVLIFDLDIVE
jgi:hypothetical protein